MTSDERRPASSNGWTSKGCMKIAEGTCQDANKAISAKLHNKLAFKPNCRRPSVKAIISKQPIPKSSCSRAQLSVNDLLPPYKRRESEL
jgi:hypothetical protein